MLNFQYLVLSHRPTRSQQQPLWDGSGNQVQYCAKVTTSLYYYTLARQLEREEGTSSTWGAVLVISVSNCNMRTKTNTSNPPKTYYLPVSLSIIDVQLHPHPTDNLQSIAFLIFFLYPVQQWNLMFYSLPSNEWIVCASITIQPNLIFKNINIMSNRYVTKYHKNYIHKPQKYYAIPTHSSYRIALHINNYISNSFDQIVKQDNVIM